MQEKSEPLPKLLLDSIQYRTIVQFSVNRSDDMVGIKEFLLPRREFSDQFPRLPVTVADTCHDLGIQILILVPLANDRPNTLNFHAIGRMEIIPI
jgi:hypothetical protein